MDANEFRVQAHLMADRIADYFEQIEKYPVKSVVKPGELISRLPDLPPVSGESMDNILHDFDEILMPGITHWQSPGFMAYFPANSSYPSVLAEMLTAALGQQGMIWETSPAATELEVRVMEWIREMCGLPGHWTGVLQDTASVSTLVALISAREKATAFGTNDQGFYNQQILRIYCSTETHSSVEKAARIAGFGRKNLVKIDTGTDFELNATLLKQAIEKDLAAGYRPCCVVASIGTTGSTAIDPIRAIGEICHSFNIWLHVDAAFAGTAFILPEMRKFADGLELADSYVFNPHKWMFTNFDASAYFVRDTETLISTFEILPEYLKTRTRGQANDFRDWGIALGRRFRALKLWFVIRNFGVEGLRNKVRLHLDIASRVADLVRKSKYFELMAPVNFSLVCFRYAPSEITDETELNTLNEKLLQKINSGGNVYLTHTKLKGKFTLRMVTAQTTITYDHALTAWAWIEACSQNLNPTELPENEL